MRWWNHTYISKTRQEHVNIMLRDKNIFSNEEKKETINQYPKRDFFINEANQRSWLHHGSNTLASKKDHRIKKKGSTGCPYSGSLLFSLF